MDLKEYFKIIRNNAKIFWAAIIVIVAGSFAYFLFRPVSFNIALVLNVTRNGSQNTSDYKYDDFYRLQADERFADTVVRWLASPIIIKNINDLAKAEEKIEKVKAERLSSQMMQISFNLKNPKEAKKISMTIIEILNKETEKLNEAQKEEAWFKILGSEPLVAENKVDFRILVLVSLAAGIFVGFWAALIKHYLN